jgi:hypothetical protein
MANGTVNLDYLRTGLGVLKPVEDLITLGDLGESAFYGVGEADGSLMPVGAFGLGSVNLKLLSELNAVIPSGIYRFDADTLNRPFDTNGVVVVYHRSSGAITQLAFRHISTGVQAFLIRWRHLNGWSDWYEIWHSGNATVDSNGFLVESSPILRLFADRIEDNGQVESAGFIRKGVGDYSIADTLGFAQQGWYIKTPQDANGNIKVYVEYEYTDGVINVQTFEPVYEQGRVTKGAPLDIPEGRWIDLRLHSEESVEDLEEAAPAEQESMGD